MFRRRPGVDAQDSVRDTDLAYPALVAVGLAAIDRGEGASNITPPEPAVQAAVNAMDVHELCDLVMRLAQRDGEVRPMLEVRATAEHGNGG